jgi:hypothetical protein
MGPVTVDSGGREIATEAQVLRSRFATLKFSSSGPDAGWGGENDMSIGTAIKALLARSAWPRHDEHSPLSNSPAAWGQLP